MRTHHPHATRHDRAACGTPLPSYGWRRDFALGRAYPGALPGPVTCRRCGANWRACDRALALRLALGVTR